MNVGLEGWIAGLIAASVTIVATSWLAGRARRRAALETALTELALRSDTLALGVLLARRDLPVELMSMTTAVAHAEALASQRSWPLPAKVVAPWRAHLAETLRSLSLEMNSEIGRVVRRRRGARVELSVVLVALGKAADEWHRDPSQYARGSLAPKLLEEARKPRPKSGST